MYMADVSVAIRTYFSISSDEWSDGPLQVAARAITSGSREAYMSALRQFAKNSESSDTLEVALNKRICAIARRKRGRSAATGLVSALRVLEKLRLLPPSVLQLHLLQVEAIARITAPHAPPRPYGTAQHLEFLGRARIHWAWPRLFFLATCAVVFRMRSGDSESVSWEGITTPGWIEFFDEKRGKEWVQYPLSPFLEQWRKYVLSLKHPNTPPQSPVLPGGRNALRSIQKECMQHCPLGHITWHPWARMAAAAFRILGGTLASLADWGRWKDLKQARHYAKAPADWSLPEFLSLPYPESFTGFPSRDMGGVSIRTKDVWPREAWEKRTGPRKPTPKPAPESVERQKPRGTAGENRGAKPDQSDSSEDSSSSGDSSDEGMEVDEDTTNPPPPPDVADAGAGTTEPAAATAPIEGSKNCPIVLDDPRDGIAPPKVGPTSPDAGRPDEGLDGVAGEGAVEAEPTPMVGPREADPQPSEGTTTADTGSSLAPGDGCLTPQAQIRSGPPPAERAMDRPHSPTPQTPSPAPPRGPQGMPPPPPPRLPRGQSQPRQKTPTQATFCPRQAPPRAQW